MQSIYALSERIIRGGVWAACLASIACIGSISYYQHFHSDSPVKFYEILPWASVLLFFIWSMAQVWIDRRWVRQTSSMAGHEYEVTLNGVRVGRINAGLYARIMASELASGDNLLALAKSSAAAFARAFLAYALFSVAVIVVLGGWFVIWHQDITAELVESLRQASSQSVAATARYSLITLVALSLFLFLPIAFAFIGFFAPRNVYADAINERVRRHMEIPTPGALVVAHDTPLASGAHAA